MSKGEKMSEKATDAVKKAGKSLKDATTKAAENAASLNNKVIDHAEANTRAAFAAMRSAASVKSVTDLAKIQTDYVKEQGARSMTQAKEVGDMIAQFGRDAMAAWRPKSD
ncbi:MAG: phasin family protein [Pseudomonadota bacterium]